MYNRGVTRSRATRSREIKLDDITRRVKNLSREISELSKLLFVAFRGSNAPLLRLGRQTLTKEKEKKKRRRRRGSRGSSHRQPEWRRKIPVLPSKMPPPLLNDLFGSILGTRRKLWMAVEWLIRHGQYQVVSDILGQTLFALFALCIDGVELWFGFAHNIVCTWKKRELFNLIYFTSTFINFSFSFNFMNVKSYNKTFQNACATRLNKSLLVQSYILSL